MDDTPHPAKFSPQILDLIEKILHDHLPVGSTILDPFGGVGLIHRFSDLYQTRAIELEREWAEQAMRLGPTLCGDFFDFHPSIITSDVRAYLHDGYYWPNHGFDAVVTSPTYANRMADNHNAQERCKACKGTGHLGPATGAKESDYGCECPKCEGAGKRNYKRMTYTHQLGRKLSNNSSAGMRWGNAYRWFHMKAWRRVCRDILSPAGEKLFIVNVKNHIREGKEVDVAGWHRDHILKLDMDLIEDYKVPVKGMGFGENRDARVAFEHVMVFRGKDTTR